MSVTWEEPPGTNAGSPRKNWAAVAAELRERPGQWAVVDTDAAGSFSSNVKRGVNKSFLPVTDWEFVSRGFDKNTKRYAKVYGRYIGGVK